jgi:hypothetical protein
VDRGSDAGTPDFHLEELGLITSLFDSGFQGDIRIVGTEGSAMGVKGEVDRESQSLFPASTFSYGIPLYFSFNVLVHHSLL